MSERRRQDAEEKAAAGGAARGIRPPWAAAAHGDGMPGEKSQNFLPSAKRVLGLLRPEAASSCGPSRSGRSVVAQRVGPKILGKATDLIFAGCSVPSSRRGHQGAGVPGCAPAARPAWPTCRGDGRLRAGSGHRLRRGRAGSCCSSSRSTSSPRCSCGPRGGCSPASVKRTIYRAARRRRGQAGRLPLAYFDGQPRGELLSRVTNDIDNVAMPCSRP
jgi:ATP-binding cassette subfamily B multidrug efflux pump